MSIDDDVLSVEEVAVALGVHYMTAYRYVKRRALEAIQVEGQWQIRRSDLEAFVSSRSERRAKAQGSPDSRRTADYHSELHRCLVESDANAAFEVLRSAIDSGAGMEEVYLDILSPVLAQIGASWARGEIDISVEHRATAVATRLVGQLSQRCVRRGRHRGNVLIGGPAGERHSLALAMLGDLLRLHGWDVSDLGADTPQTRSFTRRPASTTWWRWVSASLPTSRWRARRSCCRRCVERSVTNCRFCWEVRRSATSLTRARWVPTTSPKGPGVSSSSSTH
jgi:excisionase family DNA binding protein